MGTIVRLSYAVSRISIGAMVVGTIAVYALHLGDWTLLGVRVYDHLAFVSLLALFTLFLNDLVFQPILSGQVAKLCKQTIMLADEGSVPAGQVSFANEVIDAMDRREKAAERISAIIGVVCYFVLGPRVGSPISEYIALAVLLFFPLLLLSPLSEQLKRMEFLNPSICQIACRLYESTHMSISNGTME